MHIINLSATEDEYHPEEKKPLKKGSNTELIKPVYLSHSNGAMRLRIEELRGVLEWQKYFFQIGYFKRQITINFHENIFVI